MDYEAMLEQTYRTFVRPGDICVDVGAHAGRHTVPIAECCGPTGRILAFEPIPAMAAGIRDLIATDARLGIVRLEECALADTTGDTEFVVVREAPGYSGLRERVYDQEVTTERVRVKLRQLDDFAAELDGLRYIKIDCEGAELLVLRGAREVIRRNGPIISFECGDASLRDYEYNAGDIFDFFDAMGYRIRSITGDELDRSGFIEASARQQYWDYLAFPR